MTEQTALVPGSNFIRKWPTVLLAGLVSIGLGVAVIAWPDRTLLVLVVFMGIQMLLVGALRMLYSLMEGGERTGLLFLVGVLGIVAGLFVMREPARTVEIFVTVVGLYWLLSGLVDVFQSIGEPDRSYAQAGLAGGVITALGGAVLLFWPGATLVVIAWIVGLTLIVSGLVQAALAMQMRSAQKA